MLVDGDVGERVADVEWALGNLRRAVRDGVWEPGNHELWDVSRWTRWDAARARSAYRHLVEDLRAPALVTPEDPTRLVWRWRAGSRRATVSALDYTLRPTAGQATALRPGVEAGIVCRDESCCTPEPVTDREA